MTGYAIEETAQAFPGEIRNFDPENNGTFRKARMLLLLDVARTEGRAVASIDRLGFYEFFADNPFIVVDTDSRRDVIDRMKIELAGFSRVQLSYASSGQRFVSRRRRLQHDIARLVSRGLVTLGREGYAITDRGGQLAGDLRTVYADNYRISAEIVLRRLSGMSNRGLTEAVERWLGRSWLLVDLLEDVHDVVVPSYSSEAFTSDRDNAGRST